MDSVKPLEWSKMGILAQKWKLVLCKLILWEVEKMLVYLYY
jgi:hypothetical protein